MNPGRSLQARDRILLHLALVGATPESSGGQTGAFQEGIALALGIRRNHVAELIGDLEHRNLISAELARMKGAQRRRKSYRLTSQGSHQLEMTVIDDLPDGLRIPPELEAGGAPRRWPPGEAGDRWACRTWYPCEIPDGLRLALLPGAQVADLLEEAGVEKGILPSHPLSIDFQGGDPTPFLETLNLWADSGLSILLQRAKKIPAGWATVRGTKGAGVPEEVPDHPALLALAIAGIPLPISAYLGLPDLTPGDLQDWEAAGLVRIRLEQGLAWIQVPLGHRTRHLQGLAEERLEAALRTAQDLLERIPGPSAVLARITTYERAGDDAAAQRLLIEVWDSLLDMAPPRHLRALVERVARTVRNRIAEGDREYLLGTWEARYGDETAAAEHLQHAVACFSSDRPNRRRARTLYALARLEDDGDRAREALAALPTGSFPELEASIRWRLLMAARARGDAKDAARQVKTLSAFLTGDDARQDLVTLAGQVHPDDPAAWSRTLEGWLEETRAGADPALAPWRGEALDILAASKARNGEAGLATVLTELAEVALTVPRSRRLAIQGRLARALLLADRGRAALTLATEAVPKAEDLHVVGPFVDLVTTLGDLSLRKGDLMSAETWYRKGLLATGGEAKLTRLLRGHLLFLYYTYRRTGRYQALIKEIRPSRARHDPYGFLIQATSHLQALTDLRRPATASEIAAEWCRDQLRHPLRAEQRALTRIIGIQVANINGDRDAVDSLLAEVEGLQVDAYLKAEANHAAIRNWYPDEVPLHRAHELYTKAGAMFRVDHIERSIVPNPAATAPAGGTRGEV